jgi:hypothetical protein
MKMTQTSPSEETVDGTAIELDRVAESGPIAALGDIEQQADALKARIEAAGMVTRIGDREHLGIEALSLAATMYNISAHVVWSRPLDDGKGWEARAEARTGDGRIVGAGESMCTRDEPHWRRRPDFALRGMAQTRSLSRALRGPVGSVVALASYAAVPAEEADSTAETAAAPAELPEWARAASVTETGEALVAVLEGLGVDDPPTRMRSIGSKVREFCGGEVPACVLEVLKDLKASIPRAESESAT